MFRKRFSQSNSPENNDNLDAMIAAARNTTPDDHAVESAQDKLLAAIRERAAAIPQTTPRKSRLAPPPFALPARNRRPVQRVVGLSLSAAILLVLVLLPLFLSPSGTSLARAADVGAGELRIVGPDGQPTGDLCPLKHTDVEANITGFVSRTILRQQFSNPSTNKIEAVYVFPLPQDAAVDSMVIVIGQRRIVGKMKPRDEARAAYNAARSAGRVAAILDQERPNIFTQSVANIEPGAQVEVEISYVETLKSENGHYQFMFPMTVAERYMPGSPTDTPSTGTGTAPDTTRVPDASRISPPTHPSNRAGTNISLQVFIEAGTELFDLQSELHSVQIEKDGPTRAIVSLARRDEIPNRDFILKYRIATDRITDAFLTSSNPRGNFFTLMLQPPRTVAPAQAMPKEMIFVIDRSGSMNGRPIEKAKEAMRLCIEQMNPHDSFNLLSFSGGTGKCFDKPLENTPENRATALGYLEGLGGSGGTEMMPAIMEALSPPPDPNRVRIVCFMTDGEIGNDFEIIDAVKKNAATSRVFAFGIGNSVNRFLLDGIAREGRGVVEYLTCECQDNKPAAQRTIATDGSTSETQAPSAGTAVDAAHRFAQRIAMPVLTDITVDWGTLPVSEVYPKSIPDLFSNKPIMLYGKLNGPATGSIWLRGKTVNGPFERQVNVTGNTSGVEQRDALDSLWARAKVDHLMHQDLHGLQRNDFQPELRDEITSLGVQFSIMTQFTSFVAVDETMVTRPAPTKTVAVPVAPADGVAGEKPADSNLLWDFAESPEAQAPALPAISQASPSQGLRFDPSPAVPATTPVARTGKNVRFYANDGKADQRSLSTAIESYYVDPNNAPASPAAGKTYSAHWQETNTPGAPVISHIPDLQVGDMEDNVTTDNNYFVFTNAFKFSNKVSDYDPTAGTVSKGDVWAVRTGDERPAIATKSETTDWQKSDPPLATYRDVKFSPTTTAPGALASRQAATTPMGVALRSTEAPAVTTRRPLELGIKAAPETTASVTSTTSLSKLSPALQQLLKWETVLNADGNTSAPVSVQNYRVRVIIRVMADAPIEASQQLSAAGVVVENTSETGVREFHGGIDVRRLAELAALPLVQYVAAQEEVSSSK